jgi:prevent-host-death family protein
MPTTDRNETTVNFREFRKNLSGYLRQARQGSHFVVTSRGEEVARIMPPASKAHQKRQLIGMFKGQFQMAPDFDETPADLIAAMEGDDE